MEAFPSELQPNGKMCSVRTDVEGFPQKRRKLTRTESRQRRDKVVVRVPATTANLGPGFDAMGMAVDIWNEFTVERADKFSITTEGEGTGRISCEVSPTGESDHTVMKALRRAFEYAGEIPMPPVSVICKNRVPVCSGFGSSSAAIVGGLVAGLVLAGKELRASFNRGDPEDMPEELLQLATEMEGHPDNVAPAIYGGIQLCVGLSAGLYDGGKQLALSQRVPTPDGLRLVVYIPSEEARFSSGADKTVELRSLLQPTVSRSEAVFNIQRTALLVDALHRGDLTLLRVATDDMLHQPVRGQKKYPHLYPMIRAALDAGAHGSFLSGAGPTVLAICSGAIGDIFTQKSSERQELAVAEAMRKAASELPPEHAIWGTGKFYIVSPSTRGAHVVTAEPMFSDTLATFGSLDGML